MLKEVSGTVVNSSSPTNYYLDSVIYACDNADVEGEFDTSIRMKDKWNTVSYNGSFISDDQVKEEEELQSLWETMLYTSDKRKALV